MKYEDIDLIAALQQITDIHTENYKEDFELDRKLLQKLAVSDSSEDKHLLWMSRPSGTYLLREREVYIEDTFENKTWEFYHDQTSDPILAYALEITGTRDGTVIGNMVELDYAAHVERMKQLTVDVDRAAVTFSDDSTYYLPFKSYRREAAELEGTHGKICSVGFLPENEQELAMILRRERFKASYHAQPGNIDEHIHQLAVRHGKAEEELAVLPLAAQTAYNEVKEAHPDSIVCFAQNGYFEIYGEDAKKAAPLLGSKLLMKELEGCGKVAVTGFRQEQWVAKAKKLWEHGNDVLLTQTGADGKQEVVKDLRAEDFIPVGMVMGMDGKTVRVESVDFAANDVRLTDITDPKMPQTVHEMPAIVRIYVEEAPAENLWAALDREKEHEKPQHSVLAKLRQCKADAGKDAPKPQLDKKTKSKEMEI